MMGSPARNGGTTAVDGAMGLIVLLLVVQVWLLSATLDAFLAGHREVAVPGAIVSGLLFLACFALYQFVERLERQSHKGDLHK
jgi:predicted Co/Zn/Cd cation transporter (cation efflux family)